MSIRFTWTQTEGTRLHELQVGRFLRDFPMYAEFAEEYGLTGRGSIILSNEAVERTKRYFDASITFHNRGELGSDLRNMGKVAVDHLPDYVEGYMSPDFRGSDKFYIALTAFDNKSITPSATFIHELGHLVEEQVRLNTKHFVSTAYVGARKVLIMNGMATDEASLHHLTDEWVAWVNSIWISRLLNIDIQHAILGMVMDQTGWEGNHNNIVSRSMGHLVKGANSRRRVRHGLATAETSRTRCSLINELTTHFFYFAAMKRLPALADSKSS